MLYMVTFTVIIPPNVSIYNIHGSYGIWDDILVERLQEQVTCGRGGSTSREDVEGSSKGLQGGACQL